MIGEQIYIPRPGTEPLVRHKFEAYEPGRGDRLKPSAGLWTSTYETSNDEGWESWCKSEEMDWLSETGYLVTPRADANVFEINPATFPGFVERFGTPRYPGETSILASELDIDWAKVAEAYDGVRVTTPYHETIRYSHVLVFYAWDCESTWWARWCFEEDEGRPVKVDLTARPDWDDDE